MLTVLSRLLWVRCRGAAEAMKAADLILRDGNLPLVLLDLAGNPPAQFWDIPATTKGVVVSAIDPSSDAAAEGLQRGDIILSINQAPTATAGQAAAAVEAARKAGRQSVLLLVQRGARQGTYVGVKIMPKK